MKQEPTDKFSGIQRHQLHLIAVGVITPANSTLTTIKQEGRYHADKRKDTKLRAC